MTTELSQPVTQIPPVPAGVGNRPFWSVMIPTYNPRANYLEETLRSVLAQDPGAEQMQIEVVDDCSPKADVEAMVKAIGGQRVKFSQTPKNLGLAGCWNTCIERSRGHWVHILHQDDFVLPGFYKRLAREAELHPEIGLLATRSFFTDENSFVTAVTIRLEELENGSQKIDAFYYDTPILFPGIVVKRNAYEAQGGFRSDLSFVLDCEMWVRQIAAYGGLVTSDVLACYRKSSGNETTRLFRNGESFRDIERLNRMFAKKYPDFDPQKAVQRLCDLALWQSEQFTKAGDEEAAKNNLIYWKRNASFKQRLRRLISQLAKKTFG